MWQAHLMCWALIRDICITMDKKKEANLVSSIIHSDSYSKPHSCHTKETSQATQSLHAHPVTKCTKGFRAFAIATAKWQVRDTPHSVRHAWTPRPKSQTHHFREKSAANKYCSAHYTNCTAWPPICISRCAKDNLNAAPVVPTKAETRWAQEERGIRGRK